MTLTDNQQRIERAIRSQCSWEDPLVTVADIADASGLCEQTVHNNIGAVLQQREKIEQRTVGQANVYFTHLPEV